MDKLKKVFSPGASKDDEIMYGTPSKEGASATDSPQAPQSSTLQTQPDAEQKDKGVLRQVFNPGGDKYSEQSYGTTATAQPPMSDQLQKEPVSSEPLKGTETAQYNNDKVQQEPIDSTSASGTGTTSLGPSTMAREDNYDDVSGATYTARSYALGSGHSSSPNTSSNVEQATRETTALGSAEDQPREHSGRRLDHSLAGAATGGAGAGYVGADELNKFMEHGRDPEADNATYTSRDHYVGSSSDADPFNRPGHELSGGSETVGSAGEMAPGHIPGEFPTEDGGDPHNNSSGTGTGTATAAGVGAGAGAGAAGIAAARAYNTGDKTESSRNAGSSGQSLDQSQSPIQTTTNAMRSGSFSKPSQETTASAPKPEEKEKENSGGFKGALAAATAAMGLGGAGAYAASKDDEKDANDTLSPKQADTSTTSQTSRAAEPASSSAPMAAATSSDSKKLDEPQSAVSNKTQSYSGSRPTENRSALQPSESTDPARQSTSQEAEKGDNTARNAALGAGAAGAAGAGAYALGKSDSNMPSNVDSTGSGNAPSVVSEKTQAYHRRHPGDEDSNLRSSGTSAPAIQTQTTSSQPEQPRGEDNTARNAALGAGAVGATGAAGAGAYALNKDDNGNAQSVVSPETQQYTGSHPGDTRSSLQGASSTGPSTTQPQPATESQPQQSQEEDHTARNAALGAGAAGAAGAGAYALSKDDDGNAQSVVSPGTQKYTGSHPSDTTSSNLGGSSTGPSATQTLPADRSRIEQPKEEEDHTARNAALGVGAAGAAGAGAYALSKDDNGNARSVVSPETQGYTGRHPGDDNEALKSSSTVTPSTSANQTQPPRQTQQPEEEEDHTARNAALGAGAVGAAGAGAYALSRDDDKAQPEMPTEQQKYADRQPAETTRATQEPEKVTETKPKETKPKETKPTESKPVESKKTEEPTRQPEPLRQTEQPRQEEEDHTARNVALGAGGVGAAGAGAYALSRDDDKPQQAPQYASHQASQSYPSDRMDDSAVESSFLGSGSMSSGTGLSDRTRSRQPEQDQGHNYGRDAAVVGGTGAAGAAGYGAYEYANREQAAQQTSHVAPHEPATAEHDPRIHAGSDGHSKLHKKGFDQEEDHTGRNAALGVGAAGTAGAAGYGAKEYYDDKQDSASGDGSQGSGEKKHGFMHKILHPREHKREKEEEERRRSSDNRRSVEQSRASPSPAVPTGPSSADNGQARDGSVTEPHTGLPMNVEKYGSGAGGTDGGQQIHGYHDTR